MHCLRTIVTKVPYREGRNPLTNGTFYFKTVTSSLCFFGLLYLNFFSSKSVNKAAFVVFVYFLFYLKWSFLKVMTAVNYLWSKTILSIAIILGRNGTSHS